MAMSMTGFGRAKVEEDGLEITVEIKTFNHRYLDVSLRIPRSITFVEEDLRKLIQNSIHRGRVEVHLTLINQGKGTFNVEVNQPLLESYLNCFNDVAQTYGIKNDVGLSTLIEIQDLFMLVENNDNEEYIKNLVIQATAEALDVLRDMREKEGFKLRQDIIERSRLIGAMVRNIEERAPIVVEEYRKKLKTRISDLLEATEIDENRFNAEVAYFADRSNITEEIVRLYSHLEQMEGTLAEDGSIGRKLDFIVQEMNREANTIGSKANDLTIVNLVVDIKSEIEKIREQIQNIE